MKTPQWYVYFIYFTTESFVCRFIYCLECLHEQWSYYTQCFSRDHVDLFLKSSILKIYPFNIWVTSWTIIGSERITVDPVSDHVFLSPNCCLLTGIKSFYTKKLCCFRCYFMEPKYTLCRTILEQIHMPFG